jgi:hypothetical protein
MRSWPMPSVCCGQRSAPSSDGEDVVMISIDAHGYAEVAGHREQIFSNIDTALDFIRQCGGRPEICAVSDQRARRKSSAGMRHSRAPWLADS